MDKKIKKYGPRTKVGMIAAKIGCDRSIIANIFAGRQKAGWENAKRFAAAFPETSPIWWKEGSVDLISNAIKWE
jgi:hypothetical protein